MAYFEILEEVRIHDRPDYADWNLCFQFGIYNYDATQADAPGEAEAGYRFIWRRKNGNLQGARGQARLKPQWMAILTGKAAQNGWYPDPPLPPGVSY